MSKPIIAIDCDDVLSASAEGFIAFSNDTYGTTLTINDYTEHWAELWQIDHSEVQRRADDYYASDTMHNYKTKPSALEVLTALKERFVLVVVTSRQTKSRDITVAWIEKHYPGIFSDVHFAGIFDDTLHEGMLAKTKGALFALHQVKYVIDDQMKHCDAAREAGAEAILFGDYPWNQADTLPAHVTRCHDWQAVLEYFDERG